MYTQYNISRLIASASAQHCIVKPAGLLVPGFLHYSGYRRPCCKLANRTLGHLAHSISSVFVPQGVWCCLRDFKSSPGGAEEAHPGRQVQKFQSKGKNGGIIAGDQAFDISPHTNHSAGAIDPRVVAATRLPPGTALHTKHTRTRRTDAGRSMIPVLFFLCHAALEAGGGLV